VRTARKYSSEPQNTLLRAGLRKTRFFKKKTTHLFFLKKNVFLGFFKKKQAFVLFSKKTKKPILNCVYSIMQYHYFQNYTIITCYTYYGIQN